MIVSYAVAQTVGTVAIPTAWLIGGALTVAVVGAVTEPMHDTIGYMATRVWAGLSGALRFALRAIALVAFGILAYRLMVTYLHLGWRRQRHAYERGVGRHRPSYVKRHPWTPVRTWSVTA